MRVKVTAPRAITEKVLGLAFVDGVTEFDTSEHRAALAYFQRHTQYRVEQVDEPAPEAAPKSARSPKKEVTA